MCRVSQISRWLKTRVYDSSQKLGGHRVKGLCCGWAIDEMLFVGGYQICVGLVEMGLRANWRTKTKE